MLCPYGYVGPGINAMGNSKGVLHSSCHSVVWSLLAEKIRIRVLSALNPWNCHLHSDSIIFWQYPQVLIPLYSPFASYITKLWMSRVLLILRQTLPSSLHWEHPLNYFLFHGNFNSLLVLFFLLDHWYTYSEFILFIFQFSMQSLFPLANHLWIYVHFR